MTAVVIILVALFFVVLATWTWRSMWSERRSIDSHEHAMEVLREMAERREEQVQPPVRPPRRVDDPVRPGAVPDLRPRRDLVERLAEHPPARPALSQVRPGEGPSLAENLASAARLRGSRGEAAAPDRRRARAARVRSRPKTVFVADDAAPAEDPGLTVARGSVAAEGLVAAGAGGPGSADDVREAGPSETLGSPPPADELLGVTSAPGGPGAVLPRGARRSAPGGDPARRWSSGVSRWPGGRRGAAAVAAAVVVLAVVVPAVVYSGGSAPTAGSGSTAASSPSTRHHSSPAPSKPTSIVPLRSDQNGSVYQLTTTSYELAIAANGPCWVEVLQGQDGPQLYEGTLNPGDVHTVPASGPLWVRVGDAAHMSATIDNIPVVMPGANGAPYDMSFVPA